jgi:hypothetical protein
MELWSDGVLEYWSPLQLLWPPPDALPLMSFSHGSRTLNASRWRGDVARQGKRGKPGSDEPHPTCHAFQDVVPIADTFPFAHPFAPDRIRARITE